MYSNHLDISSSKKGRSFIGNTTKRSKQTFPVAAAFKMSAIIVVEQVSLTDTVCV